MTGNQTTELDATVAGAVRGLFGRDAIYMIVWGVQLVAAALVTPLMTRLLDVGDFGRVAAANAVMQVLFVLAGLGLYPAIQRQYAAKGERDAAKLLTLSVVGAALLTALADVSGPWWSSYLGFPSYAGPVRIAVLWAGVSAVTNSGLALLRSQDRLLAFSTVSLLQSVVAEVTSLVLVSTVQASATMFLLGQLCVQVVAACLALVLVPPRMLVLSDRPLVRAALVYGIPLIPAVLCTFVLNSADRLIVQSELGPTAVAHYQVAYNIGALPILLVGVLNASWMPRIFSFSVAGERAAVLAASRDVLLRLLIPVVIGLSVGAPIVLRIWAPAEYRPDDLLMVTAVIVVSVFPYAAGLTSTRALMAVGRTGVIALAQAVAAVSNIVLNLALIPRYGLLGSAVATLLAYAVLHRLLRIRARALVPATPPPRLLAAVAMAALVALAAAAAPTSEAALDVRFSAAAVTLGWFAVLVRQTQRPGGR